MTAAAAAAQATGPRHIAASTRPQPERPERRFVGIAGIPGDRHRPAVRRASNPNRSVTRQKIQAADIAAEGARLDAAIVQSHKQLVKLRARLAVLPEETQSEIAPLIDAYIRMIGPSRLIRGVRRRIEETLLSAESAVMSEADEIAAAIMGQAEPGMSAEDHAGLHRRGDEMREIAPAPGAQFDAGAVPQFRRPAGRRDPGQRVAAPGRCGTARSVAAWPAWSPRKVAPTVIPR